MALYVIAYDIGDLENGGQKRLSRVAKTCEHQGQRVQNSVFEFFLTYDEFILLRNQLLKLIDLNADSLKIYKLGNNYESKKESYGCKDSLDLGKGNAVFF